MNKFHFSSSAIKFSFMIGIIVYFASYMSDTPRYLSFLLSAVISFAPYFYLAFLSADEFIIKKWLDKSAVSFMNLTLMSILAYLDFIWFDWA